MDAKLICTVVDEYGGTIGGLRKKTFGRLVGKSDDLIKSSNDTTGEDVWVLAGHLPYTA
jgi:hypothetical protein